MLKSNVFSMRDPWSFSLVLECDQRVPLKGALELQTRGRSELLLGIASRSDGRMQRDRRS
jgi:hypothetical protein